MRPLLGSVLLTTMLALAPAPRARADTRPLSLAEALRIAHARSPTLKKAAAQTQAAEARAVGSRAKLLPQVTGTYIYQYTTDNFVQRPGYVPGTGSVATTTRRPDPKYDFVNSYNFQIVANQLVYDFGMSTEAFKADRETARSQAETARATQLTTEYSVRNAFFLARAQRALIAVAEQTLANQEKHLAQIQAFVEVGTRPEIDLAQARTDVANARVQLLSAQNNYASAKQNLKLVLGGEADVDYEVTDDTLEPLAEEEQEIAQLFDEALQNRPEFVALRHQQRAQELRTRAAKGRFGPSLLATSAMSEQGIQFGQLTWNTYVGATLSWQLSEGGAALAALHESQANERSVEADLTSLELQVRSQLEQARLTVHTAKATLEAAGEALANARARLGLAEGRYEAGVGNAIELGDAQLALTSADAQRVQFEYNLASARAQLLSALGKVQ
jgi:outer membrane protein